MEEEILWSILHKAWQDIPRKQLLAFVQAMEGFSLREATPSFFKQYFPTLEEKHIQKFFQLKSKTDLGKAEKFFTQQQVHLLKYTDNEYPQGFRNLPQQPPFLYYRGNLVVQGLNIGLVGSRRADSYGKAIAEELARELSAAGVCVISGLAKGIDTAAHKGAITALGGTIAVLGCGIDVVYPAENRNLASEITTHLSSAVISEFPLGTKPLAYHFPMRNRLISALADGIVIVQATEKSGALITAEFALEQGKDVFAVPGAVHNPLSVGPHQLLREGAKIVTKTTDILEEYGQLCLFKENKVQAKTVQLEPKEELVYNLLSAEPVSVEEIARCTRLPIAELMSILTALEMKEYIQQVIGRKYIRIY